MSLIAAVTPSESPQVGVKRPLQGKPTNVPNNLPAFRGRNVEPGGAVKVPKLTQGNRPNEGSNIPIPYNRVCPLEFLSGWTGRLAPGDVAFIHKYPPGFLASRPNASNGTAETATMSRVIGIDGVNRLLHGACNPDGWVMGANALCVGMDHGDGLPNPTGPMSVRVTSGTREVFRLSILQEMCVDGIVKSNDEPFSFTSNGSRDAVVFNNVVQGPTLVNNGFLLYDPDANPSLNVDGSGDGGFVVKHGAQPLRTVEAYPRGSIEGGYHIGAGAPLKPERVGSQAWLGTGQYDFVAAFSGTYTSYPAQMFDRYIQPMNTLYVGLCAYEMSTDMKVKIKDPKTGKDVFADRTAAAAAECYFYQYAPFSSRKAWLCQHVQNELLKGVAAGKSKEDVYNLINATLASHVRGSKKSRFDEDAFDAVRTADLAHMVGAWQIGRVLDIKAQRYAAYEGGPADTAYSMMVDVQIGWRNSVNIGGGGKSIAQGNQDQKTVNGYYGGPRLDATIPNDKIILKAMSRRAIDMHNAQHPSLQSTLGSLVGSALATGFSLYGQQETRGKKPNPNYYLARTIGVRWPVLNDAWKEIEKVALYMANNGALKGYKNDTANLNAIKAAAEDVAWIRSEKKGSNFSKLLQISVAAFIQVLNDPSGKRIARMLGLGALKAGARLTKTLKLLFNLPDDTSGEPFGCGFNNNMFFYAFAGLRLQKGIMRNNWYTKGPNAYPTLTQMEDAPLSEQGFSMEHLEQTAGLAAQHNGWRTEARLGEDLDEDVLDDDDDDAPTGDAPTAMQVEREDAGSSGGSSSGIDLGAGTGASSLASSWASLDEPPAASTSASAAATSASAAAAPAATAPAPAPQPTPQLTPQPTAQQGRHGRSRALGARDDGGHRRRLEKAWWRWQVAGARAQQRRNGRISSSNRRAPTRACACAPARIRHRRCAAARRGHGKLHAAAADARSRAASSGQRRVQWRRGVSVGSGASHRRRIFLGQHGQPACGGAAARGRQCVGRLHGVGHL